MLDTIPTTPLEFQFPRLALRLLALRNCMRCLIALILIFPGILLNPLNIAHAEWIRLDSLGAMGDGYVATCNGNGFAAFPESRRIGLNRTDGWVSLYNLQTGHRIWTQRIFIPMPSDSMEAGGPEKLVSVLLPDTSTLVLVTNNATTNIYSKIFAPDGSVRRDWDSIGGDENIFNLYSPVCDDSGHTFIVYGSRCFRFSVNGTIDWTARMPNMVIFNSFVPDQSGGAFVWHIDYTSTQYNHYVCHVLNDGSVIGPTLVYVTPHTNNGYGAAGITYAANTRRLFLYENWGFGALNAVEVDPDSLRYITTSQVYFCDAEGGGSDFRAGMDTTWILLSYYLPDSTGQQQWVNTHLYYYATDDSLRTAWIFPDRNQSRLQILTQGNDMICRFGRTAYYRRTSNSSIAARDAVITKYSLVCYPNPTNGSLLLRGFPTGSGQIQLYNLLGQALYPTMAVTGSNAISYQLPPVLPSGSYFMVYSSSNGRTRLTCPITVTK